MSASAARAASSQRPTDQPSAASTTPNRWCGASSVSSRAGRAVSTRRSAYSCMESAPTMSAPIAWARRRARADLPLAVGPAISQMRGSDLGADMRTVLTVVVPDYDTLQEVLPHALDAVARSGSTIQDTDILGDGAFDI